VSNSRSVAGRTYRYSFQQELAGLHVSAVGSHGCPNTASTFGTPDYRKAQQPDIDIAFGRRTERFPRGEGEPLDFVIGKGTNVVISAIVRKRLAYRLFTANFLKRNGIGLNGIGEHALQ
jgi:hypothetical protein